ncbi:hypothetical protein DOTSEDRAFT_74664 [Dothistroma septosporum NZE10]|uniref:Uncharacterized protein n=1 Tax=Dothistroma septosporum (strain NZE10 / CBS 128990) TaxID=675120 RepID=N1PBW2_DOTSN|nr:hypothetical protein DOTSEDRAFT_74664 [Dothistroma septosporum NZE10]
MACPLRDRATVQLLEGGSWCKVYGVCFESRTPPLLTQLVAEIYDSLLVTGGRGGSRRLTASSFVVFIDLPEIAVRLRSPL